MYSVIERRTSGTILMRHEVGRTTTSFSSFPSSWPSLPSSLSSPCYPPSSQKLARCKSTSTCIDAEYTTFAKFIVRASKKVNDRAHRAEGGGSINILRRALAPPLTFALQRLAHLLEFLQRCLLDSRKLQAQRFQLADDRRTDHHTRKPFVIG